VPLAGGDDAGRTGGKPAPPALHLDLEGAVEGDHQLGKVVAMTADVVVIVAQAEAGHGR